MSESSNSLPRTSDSRLAQDSPVATAKDQDRTVLYLAYGSNLSAETFKGVRGIKPLSAVNVHVPSLDLTFDLPGVPYLEPCFANTRYRTDEPPPGLSKQDYHKDRWHKGLIGVVYEVTPEDYATIIATEGGGASYQDVEVQCYTLPTGIGKVDPIPSGTPFTAHTLLCPPDGKGIRRSRPDPSYAQASARYLKLITDGAEEHGLPDEYMAYLYNIRPYTITTLRQRLGAGIFLAFWTPLLLVIIPLGKTFADKDGRTPAWLATLTALLFQLVWRSYDMFFKPVFGDGERTIGDDDDDDDDDGDSKREKIWPEKRIMLSSV
ncbi:hypothetical protein F5884DRAFT_817776 [Xylogone sp. PMI_703]|nr:hypothetical protein F5884DRAFT_817776 [Xylogone sp. PMI_703]